MESNTNWSSYNINGNVDISHILGTYCLDKNYTNLLAKTFLAMIDSVDIVVTDRLHVGICGYLLGKEVILIDNSYGKLSSVYNYTCKDFSNMHLCQAENLENLLNSIVDNCKITRKEKITVANNYISFANEYLFVKIDEVSERIMWRF